MSHTRTHGGYRTGGLWAVAGIAFGVVVIGCGLALLTMLEYDERCMQGMTRGPGALLRTRNEAFPPATVCEFERGDVSSLDAWVVLGPILWLVLAALVLCLFSALVAEWFEPRVGAPWVRPMSRAEKLNRTATALFVTGSAFAMLYALAGWKLLAGPSSACVTGGDWGSNAPRTLEYSFFPPQATCQYTSGMTSRLNPDWLASLTAQSAAPALIAAVGFALAWRRRREERRPADAADRGAAATAPRRP
ncbi:hypothetical protein ACFVZH_34750 [Streptomyces sp. NPDC059534]|uniref:hypothetical protein n=1 Tax=Streptomyces sp. NPDC059534 TaxID=3346859 RepID=UPI003690B7C7